MTMSKDIKDIKDIREINRIELGKHDISPIPSLDAMTANKILNAALETNKMDPTSIPVEVLENWGNFNRSTFRVAKKFTYVLLVFTILLPMLFITPNIVAERVNVGNSQTSSAMYDIEIKGILPARGVSATLDGVPIPVHQESTKDFKVEVTDNGELEITAVSINGQVRNRKYTVNYLDTERPVFLGSKLSGSSIIITVEDTYSGINYDGIEGLKVISFDKEEGTITFKLPSEPTVVKVPDNAGNLLEMLVSP